MNSNPNVLLDTVDAKLEKPTGIVRDVSKVSLASRENDTIAH
ncbi:MAG: hypothetical protein ACRCWG_13670 [Sarcina sp.]